MTPEVAARLAELNADFYARFGEDFGESRPRLNPGVARVLESIPPGAAVIDIGCGDAKVGRRLTAGTPRARYLGLDASAALLARAWTLTEGAGVVPERTLRRLTPGQLPGWPDAMPDVALCALDLLGPDAELVPAGQADWVVAFAVFHHIPGQDRRAAALAQWARWLCPGGHLALSCWQPQRSPRLSRLSRPWAEAGLEDDALEPGDRLIGWQRHGRTGLRYVHAVSPDELDRATTRAGLRIETRFCADGHAGNFSDYVVCKRI